MEDKRRKISLISVAGEYYCEEIARLVRTSLQACVDHVDGLLRREDRAVEAVFRGLVYCGMAMSLAGVSRPASGMEHYFSHLWDMRGEEFGTPTSTHGIQCALGTLLAARLYDSVKSVTPQSDTALAYARSFDTDAWNQQLRDFLGKGAEQMILQERKEGKYDPQKHADRIRTIVARWGEITEIMEREIPSAARIEAILDAIGCPKTIEEIGLDADILPMTLRASKDIRDKYILSRLLWDIGLLDEYAEQMADCPDREEKI